MRRQPHRHGEGERLAFLALVAGALCIGFAPTLVRESAVAPVSTAFYRMLLSLPLFAVWVALEPPVEVDAPPSPREPGHVAPRPFWRSHLALLLASGFFFAGDLAVWHWSIAFTSVANAALLANLAPVFVTAYAWLVLDEKVTSRFVLALLLALAGAALLARASFDAGGRHLTGDLLGLITAGFYAGYLLTVKELRRTLSTARLMAASSLVSAVVLLLLVVLTGEGLDPGSLRGWLVLLLLAWVSQVAGQGLIAFGFKRLPASFSSVTLLVQPPAAAFVAWVVLGEGLSWWQVAGGVTVVAGILLARRASEDRALARRSI